MSLSCRWWAIIFGMLSLCAGTPSFVADLSMALAAPAARPAARAPAERAPRAREASRPSFEPSAERAARSLRGARRGGFVAEARRGACRAEHVRGSQVSKPPRIRVEELRVSQGLCLEACRRTSTDSQTKIPRNRILHDIFLGELPRYGGPRESDSAVLQPKVLDPSLGNGS